jgi:hypothetical protein
LGGALCAHDTPPAPSSSIRPTPARKWWRGELQRRTRMVSEGLLLTHHLDHDEAAWNS